MKFTATMAAAALVAFSIDAQAQELRVSHHWSEADVRHKVPQIVAAEVAAPDVGLGLPICPTQSLVQAPDP